MKPIVEPQRPLFARRSFFDQRLLSEFAVVDKVDFLVSECRGKKVLHVGCCDWPIMDMPNSLHYKLAQVCSEIVGVDPALEGLNRMRSFFRGLRFEDKLENVLDESFDVVIVPDVIEHVYCVGSFLDEIGLLRASRFIFSAPNAFSESINKRLAENIEEVHPDHKCYYSPYTLYNTLEGRGFAVQQLMGYDSPANVRRALRGEMVPLRSHGIIAVCANAKDKAKPIISGGMGSAEPTASRSDKAMASSSRLNILHTVQFYYPHVGGAEAVVQQLSERLAKRGHLVTVATTKLEGRTFSELNGVRIEEFDVRGSLAQGISGKDIERYKEFLRAYPCDVMMNYAAQQWATDLAFQVVAETKGRRANVIAPCGYSALADSRTVRWPQFASYFEHIIPTYLPQYDAAIYHSALYQDYEYAKDHGFANSVVIPNGACEEEFSRPCSINFREKYGIRTRFLGLCVANFFPGKGHDRVIECVRRMNRSDFTMVFIGNEGERLADLRAQAAGLNVRFLVRIPRSDIVAAYHAADVFLFGSYIEASPLVIIEAKASKTPFVSTDCGNVREWKGGIVCEPNEMAANVNRILDDENLRKQLAEEGWREWREKLTWEAIADRYEDLYLRLASSKGRSVTVCGRSRGDVKVSVIVPCYNQARYLPEAVESVVNQTFQDLEIIIVNDGSSDNTRQVAEDLIAKHPHHRIKLINQANQGLAASRNNGIREAQGEYILPLDSDDMIKATFLEKAVKALDADPRIGIVYTDQERFGQQSKVCKLGPFTNEQLYAENRLSYCSLFRKRVWEEAGGYNTNMRWGYEDWDFWISCAKLGWKFKHIAEPLFLYRIRSNSMYSEALEHDLELRAKIVENHPDVYSEQTKRWAQLYRRYQQSPEDFESNVSLIEHYINEKDDWMRALPHLLTCIKQQPDNVELHFYTGLAYLKTGNVDQAVVHLQRAVDDRPGHAEYHFYLGVARLLRAEGEEANRRFEDAIELKADWAAPYVLSASLTLVGGDEAAASSLLEYALELAEDKELVRKFQAALKGDDRASEAAKFLEALLVPHLNPVRLPILEPRKGPGSKKAAPGASAPQVSVIIPTYNRPEMLKEAIASVLNQSYRDFEIIVVNDGGSSVKEMISDLNGEGSHTSNRYGEKIVYVEHERNLGLAAARNTGLRLARGKYIAYLDDDDLFYPDHLQTLVSFLEATGNKVAYTDAYEVRRGGVRKRIKYSHDFDPDVILVDNYIPVLCVMHARECLDEAGYFDESLEALEDWDLWIRMSRRYKMAHIKKPTAEYRVREDASSMAARTRKFLEAKRRIYQKYSAYAEDKPHIRQVQRKVLQELEEKLKLLKLKEHRVDPELCDLQVGAEAGVKISVIIPTYNRADLLAKVLEGFSQQTIDPASYEIVVVDDGSSDHTSQVVASFAQRINVRYVRQPNRGLPAARNRGIMESSGRIVLFNDDDDLPAPNLLEEHLRFHHRYPDPSVAVFGRITWAPELNVNPMMRHVTEVGGQLFSYAGLSSDGERKDANQFLHYTYFWGGMVSCKRSFLLKHGLFDESLTLGYEDIELGYRLSKHGLKIVYNPDAVKYALRPVTFDEFCMRRLKHGRAAFALSRKYDDPELQRYLCVEGAEEKWKDMAPLLQLNVQAVKELEKLDISALDAIQANGAPLSDLIRAVLDKLYFWAFEAYRIKGIVEEKRAWLQASQDNDHGKGRDSILVIYPELPAHDRDSGSLRMFRILEILRGAGYHVTYIAKDGRGQDRYKRELESMGVEVHATDAEKLGSEGQDVEAPRIDLRQILNARRYMAAVLGPWPIAQLYMGQIRAYSPRTQVILDTIDVHHLRERRQAELENNAALLRRAESTRSYELNMCRSADLVFVTTEQDKEALLRDLKDVRIEVIPNIHQVIPDAREFAESRDIIFIGNFRHPPNLDAVRYLVGEIFPSIKERLPGVRLHIVGSEPPEEVLGLACEEIKVAGYVPDVRSYLRSCRISVAPLRFGAGMKGKIGESLAVGTPVVTTSIGAEGMGLVDGEHALIADGSRDFADAVVRLYQDETLWRRLSEKGREHISENFSQEVVAEKIVRLLGEICSRSYGEAMRPQHFRALDVMVSSAARKKAEGRINEAIAELERAKAMISGSCENT